jgi:hypothetical protein
VCLRWLAADSAFPLLFQDYDAADLREFENSILAGCDYNKDGKINKKELTMILLALAKHANEEEDAIKRRGSN